MIQHTGVIKPGQYVAVQAETTISDITNAQVKIVLLVTVNILQKVTK